MSLLEIDDLSVDVVTREGGSTLVREVDLTLEAGETLCVVGESGSGKTVTALTVMRLLEFVAPVRTRGQIRLDGIDLVGLPAEHMRSFRGPRIGMIFQEALDSLNPSQRVVTQLIEAYHPAAGARRAAARGSSPSVKAQAQQRARELLTEVGLDPEHVLRLYPHQLSGGMQQRVMIAMALMSNPDLLLADEPTTALDVTTQAEILRLIRQVQERHGMACIFITHDMGVAAQIADRIAVLYAGRLVEVGRAEQILTAPQHRYTRALLECVPRPSVRQTLQLTTILGAVPGASEELPGCRFAPRCAFSTEQCTSVEPTIVPSGDSSTGVAGDGTHLVACWNPGVGAVLSGDRPDPDLVPPAVDHTGEAVVRLDHVTRAFRSRTSRRGGLGLGRRERFLAVDDVSLQIAPGEFFGLVGESGSGKTTLGQMVAALDHPTSGTITAGRFTHDPGGLSGSVRDFHRDVQLIFQDPQSSLDPRHTIARIIAEPLRELADLSGRALRSRVGGLLEEVGLPATLMDKLPSQISGGQRQRVAIARAIAPEPRLIVADEPTSALDVSVQGQVINLLLELRRSRGLSYLFITHNLSLVLSVADRVGVMKNGRLVEVGAAESVAADPQNEYTRTLLAANPDLSRTLA